MMSSSWKNLLTLTVALGVLTPSFAPAQSDFKTNHYDTELSLRDHFLSGQFEGTLTAGPMFSPVGTPLNRPTINYAVTSLQLGYMVTEPAGRGILHGNFEIAPELFCAGVYEGVGNFIAGTTLWFRYNFIPSSSPLVPYVQLGGGFELMDLDHRIVGQSFNFNLDAGVGVRWFLSSRWSANLEYRFQHLSNASLGPRNVGVNSQGPIAGISCFF